MKERTAWIDDENKLVSFHAIDNGKMFVEAENLFGRWILGLAHAGYRIM